SRLGLASLSGARSRQLSGGQAQRVALARALASGPDLLLLDEPLSALDVEARLAVRRELREHLGTFSGPCVLVTHDPVDAVALADRLVIVEAGRVVQSGRVAEVTRRPRSAWIARLVGLNLYRGSSAHGRVGLDGGGTLVAVAPLDGPVFAAVHPRSVALHRRAPEGSPRNVWQGVVDGLDVSGDRVRVQVAGPQPIVAEITSLALRDLDLARGGDVWVSVKATEVELYRA
ncbi:MAG: TOBE domain-containing protein, partial [Actinomycetota bacterium]|nr:TOBE domain-containing protein [Actinomycetota bacterium]